MYSDCRLVILDSVTAVISPLLGGVKNPAGETYISFFQLLWHQYPGLPTPCSLLFLFGFAQVRDGLTVGLQTFVACSFRLEPVLFCYACFPLEEVAFPCESRETERRTRRSSSFQRFMCRRRRESTADNSRRDIHFELTSRCQHRAGVAAAISSLSPRPAADETCGFADNARACPGCFRIFPLESHPWHSLCLSSLVFVSLRPWVSRKMPPKRENHAFFAKNRWLANQPTAASQLMLLLLVVHFGLYLEPSPARDFALCPPLPSSEPSVGRLSILVATTTPPISGRAHRKQGTD